MKVGIDVGVKRLYCKAFKERNDVIKWEVLNIQDGQQIKVRFISTNSKNKQGIWFATDKGIEVNSVLSSQITLWEDTAPKEVTLTCHTNVGFLSIYNVWDDGRGKNSQAHSSGMIIKDEGNLFVYHCNDYGFDMNFDKLVFSIEILK